MASPEPISTAQALADKPQEAPLEQALQRPYQHGFVTDIESDSLPPGLDEAPSAPFRARRRSRSSCSTGAWPRSGAGRPWRCPTGRA